PFLAIARSGTEANGGLPHRRDALPGRHPPNAGEAEHPRVGRVAPEMIVHNPSPRPPPRSGEGGGGRGLSRSASPGGGVAATGERWLQWAEFFRRNPAVRAQGRAENLVSACPVPPSSPSPPCAASSCSAPPGRSAPAASTSSITCPIVSVS